MEECEEMEDLNLNEPFESNIAQERKMFLITNGGCFLCLQQRVVSDDAGAKNVEMTEVSLRNISRYLDIRPSLIFQKVLNVKEANSGESNCDFSVMLCSSCSSTIKKLSKLLRQVELANLLINHHLHILQQTLRVSQKEQPTDSYGPNAKNKSQGPNIGSSLEALLVERLRCETIIKSTKKLRHSVETSFPRVRLHRSKCKGQNVLSSSLSNNCTDDLSENGSSKFQVEIPASTTHQQCNKFTSPSITLAPAPHSTSHILSNVATTELTTLKVFNGISEAVKSIPSPTASVNHIGKFKHRQQENLKSKNKMSRHCSKTPIMPKGSSGQRKSKTFMCHDCGLAFPNQEKLWKHKRCICSRRGSIIMVDKEDRSVKPKLNTKVAPASSHSLDTGPECGEEMNISGGVMDKMYASFDSRIEQIMVTLCQGVSTQVGSKLKCHFCEKIITGNMYKIHLSNKHSDHLLQNAKFLHISSNMYMHICRQTLDSETEQAIRQSTQSGFRKELSGRRRISCSYCTGNFSDGSYLRFHLIQKHSIILLEKLVQFQSSDEKTLLRTIKPKDRTVICSVKDGGCGRALLSDSSLYCHKKYHCPNRKLKVCKVKSNKMNKVSMSSMPNESVLPASKALNVWTCISCEQRFESDIELQNHTSSSCTSDKHVEKDPIEMEAEVYEDRGEESNLTKGVNMEVLNSPNHMEQNLILSTEGITEVSFSYTKMADDLDDYDDTMLTCSTDAEHNLKVNGGDTDMPVDEVCEGDVKMEY